jgi:hypothetical protein
VNVTRLLQMSSVVLARAGCSAEPATNVPGATSSNPPDAAVAPSATPGTGEIRKLSAAELPIGDYLPPLDNGRIEIPIPKGWSPMPRDSKYVARFFKDDKNGLPRIEILADDKSYGGIATVTATNASVFAKAVAQDLGEKRLLEPVLAMEIGSTPCARYVMKVELKMPQGSVVAERQSLVTVHEGRAYTIQLLVLPNSLLADRDAAYAICAGAKFGAAATAK